MIITKYKQIRSDQKANTNTSLEMKISCNVKQGTSSGKNSSQTVEIKDKTNEKKPYLELYNLRKSRKQIAQIVKLPWTT